MGKTAAIFLFNLLASPGSAAAPAMPEPVADKTEICRSVDSDPELEQTLRQTDLLLLGEIHGSVEVPEFTLDAVCAALQMPGPVILGLEIPAREQVSIDEYLRSNGDRRARGALLASPFWRSSQPDGRSSHAMLELIDAARRLVQAGRPLSVFCFDARPTGPGDTRDHAMARALLAHRAQTTGARMVVLTGNLHARTRGNLRFQPMGSYLAAEHSALVALNIRRAPGQFWLCNPACGIKDLGGSGAPNQRGITRFPARDEFGYDGVFDIGVPTASLPARQ